MNKLFLICVFAIAACSVTSAENELEVNPDGAFDKIVIAKVEGIIDNLKNNTILKLLNDFEQDELNLGIVMLTNIKVKDIISFTHEISNIKTAMVPGKGICANLTLELLWPSMLIATDFSVPPNEKINGGRTDISGGIDVSIKNCGFTADITIEGMKPKYVTAELILGEVQLDKLELLGNDLTGPLISFWTNNKEDILDIVNYLLSDILQLLFDSQMSRNFIEARTVADLQKIVMSNKHNIENLIESGRNALKFL